MSTPFQIPGLTTLSQPNNVPATTSTSPAPVFTEVAPTPIQNGQQEDTSAANVNDMDVDQQISKETDESTDAIDAPPSPPSLTQGLEALLGGLDPVPDQHTLTTDAPVQHGEQNTDMIDVEVQQEDAPANGEWEADSSPYESSSSDSSSSDDSDDDDSDDEKGRLDPKELARILMEEASDDEGEKKGSASGGQLRTKNEVPEQVIPRPDVTITEDMKLVPLGEVEHIIGNTIVIKAYTSGEYQVLESGSVLIAEDRSIIAAVAEQFANVKEPRYAAYFTNEEEIKSLNIDRGNKVFYTNAHATFVFTEPLKGLKGTDASNLNDEELGVDEMEFSDDEKEAAYKKELKEKRRARQNGRGGGDTSRSARSGASEVIPNPSSLNYDDEDDGPYRPLARPANFGQGATAFTNGSGSSTFAGFDAVSYRGGRGGRGDSRGGRGRSRPYDRGGRGGRGGQRAGSGYSQPPATQTYAQQPQQQQPPFPNQQFGIAQSYPVPPPQFFGGGGGQVPTPFPFPWAQPPQNLPAGFVPPPPPQFQQQGQGGQPSGFYNPALFAGIPNQYQQQNQGGQQPGQWPHQGGSGSSG